MYGLIICLAGLFNFSQSALDALTHKVFNNDPRPVNGILLGIAVIVGTALVTFVYKKSTSTAKAGLRAEAEAAEERLMPGAENGHGVTRQDYGTL